ncbi:MAG: hydrolase [Pirellula sp.]|nr:hydrolase [Pirellula sp.]
MQQDLEIAVVQMSSSEDKRANWATADRLVRQAADFGAKLVVLPEYFNCLGDRRVMLGEAEPLDGPTAKFLQDLAQSLRIVLVGGTFCEQSADPSRAHNTCLIIDAAGVVQAFYRKLHLFDVDLPGKLTYCESSWLAPGSDVVITDIQLSTSVDMSAATGAAATSISTAPAICYDLRFPELFRRFADREVALVTVPAAFTKTTGRDHWELLCRARAVENQCFLAAANQTGRHAALETYGHSLIVDPWGVVLARAGEGEAVLRATLCANRISEVRAQLPALRHRRTF